MLPLDNEATCQMFIVLKEQKRIPFPDSQKEVCPHVRTCDCNPKSCTYAPAQKVNLREDEDQETAIASWLNK